MPCDKDYSHLDPDIGDHFEIMEGLYHGDIVKVVEKKTTDSAGTPYCRVEWVSSPPGRIAVGTTGDWILYPSPEMHSVVYVPTSFKKLTKLTKITFEGSSEPTWSSEEDEHKGQVYNPYTGEWSWL